MVFDRMQAKLDLDTSGFTRGVDDAQGSLSQLGNRARRSGRQLQSAGRTMTRGVTAPLAAMGGASVAAAASFEQNMQNSIGVMGDVDDAMREDLEQSARDVATSTTRSHNEAAESFYFLASAGLDAQESLSAMPQVAAFAEAGQMDMAQATDVATNVMSAYGLEAENIASVTDTLTGTVTNHNQTMEGMAAAFQNAAPAAASMGIEMGELAAATGMLGDVGIQASDAGTALSSIMRRLARRTGQTGNALDELGVSTTDAEGNMLPLANIIEQLEDANMSAADAAMIFGRQQSAGMALVEQGSDALRENQAAIEDSEGATQQLADTQRNTLKGSLSLLKSQLTDVAITFGDELAPTIERVANGIAALSVKFEGLSSRQRRIIAIVGAVVAAIGPLLIAIGGLIAVSGTAVSALAGIGSALSAILVPIALVTAAVAALAIAYQRDIGGMQDFTHQALASIRTAFEAAMPVIRQTVMGALTFMQQLWNTHGDAVVTIVTDVTNLVISAYQSLAAILTPIVQAFLSRLQQFWDENGQQIMTTVDEFVQAYILAWQHMFAVIKPLVKTALAAIKAFWNVFGDEIMVIVEFTMDYIFTYMSVVLDAISTLVSVTLALLQGDWSTAWEEIKSFFTETLGTMLSFATEWGPKLVTVFFDMLVEIKDLYIEYLNLVFTTVKDIFGAVLTWVTEWTGRFITAITEFLANVFQAFVDFGNDLIFGSLIKDIFSEILSVVTEKLGLIEDVFSETLGRIFGGVTQSFNDIKNAMGKKIDQAKTAITDTLGLIEDAFSSAWDFIEGIIGDIQSGADDALGYVQDTFDDIANLDPPSVPTPDVPDVPGTGGGGGGGVGGAIKSGAEKLNPFAKGGLVTGPTSAMIGEGQEDEAVMPLSKLQHMLDFTAGISSEQIQRIREAAVDGARNVAPGGPATEVSMKPGSGSKKGQRVTDEIRRLREAMEGMDAGISDAKIEVTDDGLLRFVDGRIEFQQERDSVNSFSRGSRTN